jgi:hypothetical protein
LLAPLFWMSASTHTSATCKSMMLWDSFDSFCVWPPTCCRQTRRIYKVHGTTMDPCSFCARACALCSHIRATHAPAPRTCFKTAEYR